MPYRILISLLLLLVQLPLFAAPRVVATIQPLHALAAGVMEGVAEPQLLLPPGASPHSYALTPSQAQALAQADLVVWVGSGLEQFLAKPLRTLAAKADSLELARLDSIKLLAATPGHAHDGSGHDPADYDPHLWLDVGNAERLLAALAERLAALDPAHAETYRRNAQRRMAQLQRLDAALQRQLEPVQAVPFMVFHDAYRYFTQRYGLFEATALTLNPERPPGARAVIQARQQVSDLKVRCIFSEPQFEPGLAEAVARGSGARIAVLDPIGAAIPPGPEAYPELLRRLATALSDCLSEPR